MTWALYQLSDICDLLCLLLRTKEVEIEKEDLLFHVFPYWLICIMIYYAWMLNFQDSVGAPAVQDGSFGQCTVLLEFFLYIAFYL